ncbi:MAG: hypothetical protein M3P70_09885, partial [Actinomycetota bacterium]|nr:hypothetical protein [Actinomycetota bacterium]
WCNPVGLTSSTLEIKEVAFMRRRAVVIFDGSSPDNGADDRSARVRQGRPCGGSCEVGNGNG